MMFVPQGSIIPSSGFSANTEANTADHLKTHSNVHAREYTYTYIYIYIHIHIHDVCITHTHKFKHMQTQTHTNIECSLHFLYFSTRLYTLGALIAIEWGDG